MQIQNPQECFFSPGKSRSRYDYIPQVRLDDTSGKPRSLHIRVPEGRLIGNPGQPRSILFHVPEERLMVLGNELEFEPKL